MLRYANKQQTSRETRCVVSVRFLLLKKSKKPGKKEEVSLKKLGKLQIVTKFQNCLKFYP